MCGPTLMQLVCCAAAAPLFAPTPPVQGCILLVSNPGVANAISGLATSASYQSGVDRHFLWQRRNETVPEYNMTVQEVRAVFVLLDEPGGVVTGNSLLL